MDSLVYALGARLLPRLVLRRWLLPREVKLDSLATVMFSSGSTGVPKGVMLSHRNIVSNIEGMQQAVGVNRKDCLLDILPFFHSFGFTVGLWLPAVSGFSVVYHSNPLESRKIGELCCRQRVTLLVSTPTLAWDNLQHCGPEDFKSVRLALVGAEKMKPELAEFFKTKFGVEMYEGYGCTELSPVVAVGTAGYSGRKHQQLGHKPGTVGHPIPGIAVRVVNPDTFEELGPNQEGMLLVKRPNVMMGYLDDAESTRQVITPDGWYITGDITRLDDDGFIEITDRLARFSKIAGEMVPHICVEDALHDPLGCTEQRLVVTGVSDAQAGEKLVVLHTGLEIAIHELIRRLKEAKFPELWLPRRENFHRIDVLPVLAGGKLDLRQIKEIAKRADTAASADASTGPV